MISIFYSTRKSNPKYSKNIKKSCTLKNVEIIEFVNKGTHSLAEAYNNAILSSKNDILVCIHDDIHLEKGWDRKIFDYFDNSKYGILGLAGTTDLEDTGMWWQNRNRMVGSVMHKNKKGKYYETKYSETFKNKILPVVCIDGLFIALHKQRIKSNFNEDYDGFHFYDIPFCVDNFLKFVEVGVVTDIKVKHDSIGVPNKKWHEHREKFSTEYAENLPLMVTPPIEYDTSEVVVKKEPKLAIIIPSKDNFEYLERCIKSLLKTSYSNYTIYVADTGSEEEILSKTKKLYEEVNLESKDRMKLIKFDFYHFAKINNMVVDLHMDDDTEVILFCNDDVEMLNDAVSLMVKKYNKHKKHVGTLGCRLYYGDNSIQHGGVKLFLTPKNQIGITHKGIRTYYGASTKSEFDIFGSTGAFLMISRENFFNIRGFNDEVKECFEDVILNIDCIKKSKKNIYVGEAVCYHYESVTRSKSDQKINNERHDFEKILLPYISKNYIQLKKHLKK